MTNINTPSEAVAANINGAVSKAAAPVWKQVLSAMLAGAFIAMGAASSSMAAHAVANAGLARLVTACVFPVGLIMVVLLGTELFTGNSLMIMAVMDKKITALRMLRNLVSVYIGNLLGSVLVSAGVYFSGQQDIGGGALGAYAIKTALAKAAMPLGKALVSGILCNLLVCTAVMLAATAKDTSGKILGCFFPIMAFVTAGFEHSVANMFYIPSGMLAATNPVYVQKAFELYGITADELTALSAGGMAHNLVPVTVGNVIGGIVCVGAVCYLLHGKRISKREGDGSK